MYICLTILCTTCSLLFHVNCTSHSDKNVKMDKFTDVEVTLNPHLISTKLALSDRKKQNLLDNNKLTQLLLPYVLF